MRSGNLGVMEAGVQAPARAEAVGVTRWLVCALLFFGCTINYIDRQVVGILKPTLSQELGWSELVFRLIHLHPTARLARVFFARWRLRMMDLAVAVHMKGFGCAFR